MPIDVRDDILCFRASIFVSEEARSTRELGLSCSGRMCLLRAHLVVKTGVLKFFT